MPAVKGGGLMALYQLQQLFHVKLSEKMAVFSALKDFEARYYRIIHLG
jgi:hypothetical protein